MIDAMPACCKCDKGVEGPWIVAGNPMCREHALSVASRATRRPQVVLVTRPCFRTDDPTPGVMLTEFWAEVRKTQEAAR